MFPVFFIVGALLFITLLIFLLGIWWVFGWVVFNISHMLLVGIGLYFLLRIIIPNVVKVKKKEEMVFYLILTGFALLMIYWGIPNKAFAMFGKPIAFKVALVD